MRTSDSNQLESKSENSKNAVLSNFTHRFFVGQKVNYCNGMIITISKIKIETGICYDENGMWYSLLNCKPISNGG